MAKLQVLSPWMVFYREIDAMFKKDPEVQVVYDEVEQVIKLFVDNTSKADALAQILPDEKEFGNITLQIVVIPANNLLQSSPDDLLRRALRYNDAVWSVESTKDVPGFPCLTYVIFNKEVVQYFTDNPMEHKLIVVDGKDRLCGLFTLSDILKINQERSAQFKAARDSRFRLLCGAAVSATRDASGKLDRKRILAHVYGLVEKGVDVIAVSTAHGHTKGVGESVKLIRDAFPELPIIAGNVTTGAGVEYLAEMGANVIKIGQGPGSICSTRLVAGVGIPQLTALYVASRAAAKRGVTILADGGITKSGDIVKALTLAQGVICGGVLAGCDESPGEIIEIAGKIYKKYRGMGSLAAMKAGSASRYGHLKSDTTRKIAAEGVEALKEIAGSLDHVLTQLIGGIQSGMGYLGARTLAELRQKARYVQVSVAGQREASPHDVIELKTAVK